jgi:ComF family protein
MIRHKALANKRREYKVLGFFAKQNCLICRQDADESVCHYCKADLPFFNCAQYQYNLMHWPAVQTGLSKVGFTHLLALSDYTWPLSSLLTGLKFSSRLPNALALAKLFSDHCISADHPMPQLIMPIPLHKNRYLMRKFNQSTEIAKQIGKLHNIPLSTNILYRKKATQKQTDLSASSRRKNIKRAFAVNHQANDFLSKITHIALFDDVVTTGSTADAAHALLKHEFPHLRVDIWSICVALIPNGKRH